MRKKILSLENLQSLVKKYQSHGKTIALCLGCFDLMHPGHMKHLEEAKTYADYLIVLVTADQFVDKGPGRPVFNEKLRAECIAALHCVDFVSINQWPTAVEVLKFFKPNIYVKGQEFENLEDKTGKIQKESLVAKELHIKLRFTHQLVFSSTHLINTYLNKDQTA